MFLSVYTIAQAEQWDAIVRSFAKYDVFYLSGYAKSFQMHGDGDPLLFYYEEECLRGIHVVLKRDIAKDAHFVGLLPENTYFDFVTPYGYGGWLLEGQSSPAVLYDTFRDWCHNHGVVSEFVRFELFSNSLDSYYGQVVPRTNNVVRQLDRSMDEMLMDFEHKVRKNLKKAISSGLEILVDPYGKYLEDFLRIYYGTMDRNDASQSYYFSEAFFRQLNTLVGNYVYFHVVLNGTIIASEMVIMGSDTMYSYLGGTNGEYFSFRPNDFLKYHIIRWGVENNYRQFVLGGGYGSDDGIFRYKKSFAPSGVVPFCTGQAIFNQEIYVHLINLRNNLPESEFFPLYRA